MTFDTPTADEMKLVYDAWANSYRKSPWAGCVPNNLWPMVSRTMITDILDRGARVLVAVTPIEGSDERRVMGYSVSDPARGILYWLFVKRDYRGLGVGTALLNETCPDGEWTYTCRTRASAKFLGPRFHWDDTPTRIK